jgi:hypothetical protein
MIMLVMGGYVIAYAVVLRGRPRTLLQDIGIRMGLTGIVFAAAATLADSMGFGSHITADGPLFGWLQAAGMVFGFAVAAIGVLVYGTTRS